MNAKLFCAALLLCACGRSGQPRAVSLEPASQLLVYLTANVAAPKDVDSVRVEFADPAGARVYSTALESELGATGRPLPSFVFGEVVGGAPGASPHAISFRVTSWKGASVFQVLEATVLLPDAGSRDLPLPIDWLCKGSAATPDGGLPASTCPTGQTCRGGACLPIDRTGETLPQLDGGFAPCRDVVGCFSGATAVAVDPVSCSVARPATLDHVNLVRKLRRRLGKDPERLHRIRGLRMRGQRGLRDGSHLPVVGWRRPHLHRPLHGGGSGRDAPVLRHAPRLRRAAVHELCRDPSAWNASRGSANGSLESARLAGRQGARGHAELGAPAAAGRNIRQMLLPGTPPGPRGRGDLEGVADERGRRHSRRASNGPQHRSADRRAAGRAVPSGLLTPSPAACRSSRL